MAARHFRLKRRGFHAAKDDQLKYFFREESKRLYHAPHEPMLAICKQQKRNLLSSNSNLPSEAYSPLSLSLSSWPLNPIKTRSKLDGTRSRSAYMGFVSGFDPDW